MKTFLFALRSQTSFVRLFEPQLLAFVTMSMGKLRKNRIICSNLLFCGYELCNYKVKQTSLSLWRDTGAHTYHKWQANLLVNTLKTHIFVSQFGVTVVCALELQCQPHVQHVCTCCINNLLPITLKATQLQNIQSDFILVQLCMP